MIDDLNTNNQIAIFRGKTVRKTIYKKEWWFSILDVIQILADSPHPKTYWAKMKVRDKEISQPFPFWEQLKLVASDGKKYNTDCANTEGILRVVQSIPSPKAEPFKRWLARVGYERIQEIEDPELASKRAKTLYKLKGYPDNWIEKRMRGIAVRNELTDEWDKRGAENQKDYEILTAEVSKATFGLIPSDYKKLKGLKRENLRDHMNDLELILTMLGERTTTEIHRTRESQGLPKLKDDARAGGQIAGTARKQIERKTGRSIISKDNFLPDKKKLKKGRIKK
ncbi:MAG: phage antirepressor protein [Candidatus Kerfeldbacteria bacterium RIFOXYA2_FULL_38_24]|nr:MAG: phage antirepressor protein [Candidatus Kerfeldbacteria bacterium RIFOXYA2_FULL_38_24]